MNGMENEREVLTLEPMADDAEVGRWLSAMEDARRDTLQAVAGLTDEAMDWRPEGEMNTVGTLLYHTALVEADWLVVDMFGSKGPAWPAELLPYTDRDLEGRLTPVDGTPLGQHLERLAAVRAMFLEQLQPMSSEAFHRVRRRERFDVSAAWILHHLLQHEAEHRSQISRLRETMPSTLG
jgi:uncharacterized damage-inducible protein DinB